MKKFKYYKTLVTLVTAGTLSIASGCGKKENSDLTPTPTPTYEKQSCEHLIVSFGEESILFKECEGYTIEVDRYGQAGSAVYEISDEDGSIFFEGVTDSYNLYATTHEYSEELENNVKVFKLQK